jgi:hypothetical protein
MLDLQQFAKRRVKRRAEIVASGRPTRSANETLAFFVWSNNSTASAACPELNVVLIASVTSRGDQLLSPMLARV